MTFGPNAPACCIIFHFHILADFDFSPLRFSFPSNQFLRCSSNCFLEQCLQVCRLSATQKALGVIRKFTCSLTEFMIQTALLRSEENGLFEGLGKRASAVASTYLDRRKHQAATARSHHKEWWTPGHRRCHRPPRTSSEIRGSDSTNTSK